MIQSTMMSKTNKNFVVCLILFGLVYLLMAGEMLIMHQHPGTDNPEGMRLATDISIYYGVAFSVISFAILAAFSRSASKSSPLLFALNILMLIAFPFGTAIGVYYFRKVGPANRPPPETPVQ